MIPWTPEFRQVLMRLELLSMGGTQAWDKTSPPADLDRAPKGVMVRDPERFPHEFFRERWARQRSLEACLSVLEEAQALLEHWQGVKRPVRLEVDWRAVVLEHEGLTPKQIARRYMGEVSEQRVMEIRAQAQRDTLTGRELKAQPAKGEVQAEVIRLFEQGMPRSHIVQLVGCTRQYVSVVIQRHRQEAA